MNILDAYPFGLITLLLLKRFTSYLSFVHAKPLVSSFGRLGVYCIFNRLSPCLEGVVPMGEPGSPSRFPGITSHPKNMWYNYICKAMGVQNPASL